MVRNLDDKLMDLITITNRANISSRRFEYSWGRGVFVSEDYGHGRILVRNNKSGLDGDKIA
jgi:hypothetical protein